MNVAGCEKELCGPQKTKPHMGLGSESRIRVEVYNHFDTGKAEGLYLCWRLQPLQQRACKFVQFLGA